MDYGKFLELMTKSGIRDEKYIFGYTLEVLFAAVNFDETSNEENSAKELVRYEFVEILVRIAHKLHASSKNFGNTVAEVLSKLISD